MSLLASIMAHIFRAVAPPSGAWTPAELATALWLDASDATTITIATGVSEWRDQSGNARHVSQATAGKQPTVKAAELNGRDVLGFSSDFLEYLASSDLLRNVDGGTVFAVRKYASTAGVQQCVSVSGGTSVGGFRASLGIGVVSGQSFIGGRRLDADGFQSVPTGAAQTTTWQIELGDLRYADANARIWKDGAQLNSAAFQTAGNTSDTASLSIAIGAANQTPTNAFNGDLAETIVLGYTPDTPTRQRIEGYLAHKWGLEGNLPVGHPYKNAAPTTAWTPADTTSALWLDADDETTITDAGGGAVSGWADKSGNARNVSQATAGARPAYSASGFNGKGALTFDGDSDFLSNVAGITSGTYTGQFNVFYVATRDNVVGGTIITERNSTLVGASQWYSIPGVETWSGEYLSSDGLNGSSNHTISEDTFAELGTAGAILSHIHNPGSRDLLWLNGTSKTVLAGTASNITGSAGFKIGAREGAGSPFWDGKICEVVVVLSALDDAERQRIEGYLAWKWGLEANLPAGHPYELAAPTLGGGEVYATWDPANKDASIALSDGDLTATKTGSSTHVSARGTLGVTSGKHYWEVLYVSGGGPEISVVGVGTSGVLLTQYLGSNTSGWGYYQINGTTYHNAVPLTYGASWAAPGDRIGVALDMDAGKVWFSKNGVWQDSGNPAAGTGEAYSGLTGTIYAYLTLYTSASVLTTNFGASALTYTPPAGFRAGLYEVAPTSAPITWDQSTRLAPMSSSDGLVASPTSNSWSHMKSIQSFTTGQYYLEVAIVRASASSCKLVISPDWPGGADRAAGAGIDQITVTALSANFVTTAATFDGTTDETANTEATGLIAALGIAIDFDAQRVYIRLPAGTWSTETGEPGVGVGIGFSPAITPSGPWFIGFADFWASNSCTLSSVQTHEAPAGYTPLIGTAA